MAAAKLRDLIAAGGDSIEGPWDGEEAITLMADLDAGATGAMTGGGYPDGIRQIVDPYLAGRRDEAMAAYARWLPLINYENRQCGLQAAKILMEEGGVIGPAAVRHPLQKVHPAARAASSKSPASSIPWCCAGAGNQSAVPTGSPSSSVTELDVGAVQRCRRLETVENDADGAAIVA